jgi:hypothetical protein
VFRLRQRRTTIPASEHEKAKTRARGRAGSTPAIMIALTTLISKSGGCGQSDEERGRDESYLLETHKCPHILEEGRCLFLPHNRHLLRSSASPKWVNDLSEGTIRPSDEGSLDHALARQ